MAAPRFVVQLHQASRLHYDLRLEIEGVLVSWAVPKGPSLDPAERRLAVRVGDHAMAHADVEGRLGSGAVVVWDTGDYEHVTEEDGVPVDASAALAGGHLRVVLHGRRLTGAFSLRRTRLSGDLTGPGASWLLVKVSDAGAVRGGPPVTDDPTSVLTGRSLADLMGDDALF